MAIYGYGSQPFVYDYMIGVLKIGRIHCQH